VLRTHAMKPTELHPRPGAGSPLCVSVALLSLAVHLALSRTAAAQGTVTFDGPPVQPRDSASITAYYSEGGMIFVPLAPATGFVRNGGGGVIWPENGTAYVQTLSDEAITFDSLRGVPFGLMSVDLAEYSTLFPYPWTVRFVGYRADGSTVTNSFTTDGIIDGTGPLADFETFYFDQSFTNLTRVDVPSYRWSLDNLRFSIPEPSPLALGALAASLLALRASAARLRPPKRRS
jgi:hypothetical protein